MKYKNKKIKRYFVYTSTILHLYLLTFYEMKYTSSMLLSLKGKEIYFKYTSEFAQNKLLKLIV